MTRIITLLSGKGGVGKTTLTANLGVAMADFGVNVVAVDANLTTPNLGIHLGIPLYPNTLHDVLKGKIGITDAIYQHHSGLRVVPAGISLDDLRGIDPKDLSSHLLDLVGTADFILLDASAGLGREALAAQESADEIILVSTPDLPSITDALKAAKLGEQLGTRTLGLVANRVTGKSHEMTYDDIVTMLDTPILAEIPEDINVHKAIAAKMPVVHHKPHSPASIEIKKLAAMLAGVEYQMPSWWTRMMNR